MLIFVHVPYLIGRVLVEWMNLTISEWKDPLPSR